MTTEFDVDWDLDQYHDETEPAHHWQLRREFMRVHKDKFPEEYLVALARTFTNVEFMGCIYPPPVMCRIAELSKEVAQEYRKSKKERLQRTFVTASRAAVKRVAGKPPVTDNAKRRRLD